MKIIFFLLIFLSVYDSFSQTGFRIRKLAELNQHNSSYSALWGYTAPNGREYAVLGCFSGTAFIDITDTNNIREVDFIPAPNPGGNGNNWREMKTYSHYAYIVSEDDNSNIQIADLRYLPDSVRYVGKFDLPGHSSTHSVSQSGAFLYLNGCNPGLSQGISIVDLTNPELPVLRGTWDDMYVHDSRIVNDTIWACNISDGRVTIINAVNKDNPITIRSWINLPQPNGPHNIAFSQSGDFAYVTDERTTPSAGKMKIWDVSDLNDINYIRSYNAFPFEKSVVHNVETYGNIAVTAYYSAGVQILDITNPSDPSLIGWYDTHPENNRTNYEGCWGVYMFSSGKIIASDRTRGLFVLMPDLTPPVSHLPKAKFIPGNLSAAKYDTLRLIDASDGIPQSWQWTVTGPENKTSSQKHPDFVFTQVGSYNVKLRVTNSFGSDSVNLLNAFQINPTQLNSFTVLNPVGNPFVTIITSPADTSKVLFNWRKSSADPNTVYKINFRKVQNNNEKTLLSSNNGLDTFALISKSMLDSIVQSFGMTGDSLVVSYKTKAFNETDSLFSSNSSLIIFKRNSVGIQNISQTIPAEYKLYDNYPNPFNPSTNIEFDIPENSSVSLNIYDVSGKLILQLLNDELSPGKYKYTLNGNNLNSGVYFIKFSSGQYTSVKKIVLLK
ncbi:MAG TPA: choice-of-anchor B family protein [Ignavibacteria bacterium]|nr:choice-of-anchor B family protein [Ignavibacteria bacterium]HRJ98009.1 choice-of-anchor B family protein [Ignavibacteria bacterium]